MMVYYGIADMLQMCYYVYWGVTMLFYSAFGYEISVITVSIYYSAWTLVNLMILLVALNRFDVFVPIPIGLNRKIAFNVIAVAFVLIALGQTILGLIPGFRMYSLKPMGQTYEAGMLAAYWYFDRINYIALSGAVILYLFSFVSVVIKIEKVQSLEHYECESRISARSFTS
uniref:NADH dehydrogenase subunit 6 n=1 Tax=Acrobeloides nanus TaxID=290746 RepID=A0A914E522_9BILA